MKFNLSALFRSSKEITDLQKLLKQHKSYIPKEIKNYDDDLEEQLIYFTNLAKDEDLILLDFGKFNQIILMYQKSDLDLVANIRKNWDTLKDQVLKQLEEMVESSDRITHLDVDYFQAFLGRIPEDSFTGDEADTFLEFRLLETPTWNFMIKNNQIMHCQPSY